MELGLKDKVAMVAGASRGLGYAVAGALAREGARVSMGSRNADAIKSASQRIGQECGASPLGVELNVADAASIESWHKATRERFGEVDLLVTNSGGPPAGTFRSFDDAAWQSAFELLVLSAIRMVRRVLPAMESRGGGSILLLTSLSVKEPIGNLTLSNIMRAPVAALTKTLANEYGEKGIRVNALVPGRISTDRVRELDEITSMRLDIPIEEHRRQVRAQIPLGRYGEPEEFARAAVFLLSDAAAYITGSTLQVDGGMIRSAF